MSFVVDASIAAGWFLPDEATHATIGLSRRLADDGAAAPDLFWHEVRNLLVKACRRGRLLALDLDAQFDLLEAPPLRNAGRGESRVSGDSLNSTT